MRRMMWTVDDGRWTMGDSSYRPFACIGICISNCSSGCITKGFLLCWISAIVVAFRMWHSIWEELNMSMLIKATV